MRTLHYPHTLVTVLTAGALATGTVTAPSATALHDGQDSDNNPPASVSSGGDGSVTFSVEVVVEGVAGGGGSSSGPVTVQTQVSGWVHPVCWYEPSLSGADMAAYLDSAQAMGDAAMNGEGPFSSHFTGYKDHAQDDAPPPSCSPTP